MRIYGYDPLHWDSRAWVINVVASLKDTEPGVVILVSDRATWPPWSVAWLWDAVTVHAQPVTLITDLGQFSPDVWQQWRVMRNLIAERTTEIFGTPAHQWPQYAHALGVTGEPPWCRVAS